MGFLVMAAPVFLLGGYFIYQLERWLLIPWVLFIVSYFGFIEIRVMCSHCPHYGEPELRTLKCWANYGSPKLWKYRPGAMSFLEKAVFHAGFIIIFGAPIAVAIFQERYILSGIYIVTTGAWKWGLKMLYCSRCINFACPFNGVDTEVRNRFFVKNPVVAREWNMQT